MLPCSASSQPSSPRRPSRRLRSHSSPQAGVAGVGSSLGWGPSGSRVASRRCAMTRSRRRVEVTGVTGQIRLGALPGRLGDRHGQDGHRLGNHSQLPGTDFASGQRRRRGGQLRRQYLPGYRPAEPHHGRLLGAGTRLGGGQSQRRRQQSLGAAKPLPAGNSPRVDLGDQVQHHRLHPAGDLLDLSQRVNDPAVIQTAQLTAQVVETTRHHLHGLADGYGHDPSLASTPDKSAYLTPHRARRRRRPIVPLGSGPAGGPRWS